MSKKIIRRFIKPTATFFFIVGVLTFFPTLYIALSDFYTDYWVALSQSDYRSAAWLSLLNVGVFFLFFFAGVLFVKGRRTKVPTPFYKKGAPRKGIHVPAFRADGWENSISLHRFVYVAALIACAIIWLVFLTGGYEKITLYGADLDKLEYRLLGDDRQRWLTVSMQIVRRLILPFCIVYFLVLRLFSTKYSIWFVCFLVVSLLVGIAITLERAPLMLMVTMFFYVQYIKSQNLVKLFILLALGGLLLIVLGGLLTYIQYNVQGFGAGDVLETGLIFVVNRVLMAPNFVPVELSYGLFDFSSDKLWLKYSRLFALFGGEYVMALDDEAIYVGPVGAIADIWRNLGLAGVMVFGALGGILFAKFDLSLAKLDPAARAAGTFTALSLAFYLWYGTFFSQGVFLQIFLMLLIPRIFRRDSVIYPIEGRAV